MTDVQKQLIDNACMQCDDEGRSTEYMLQFAADMAGVEIEDVVCYLEEKAGGLE